MTTIHNPKRYRELSEPFQSREDAALSIAAFQKEVEDARTRHHIRDVAFVIASNVIADGEERELVLVGHYGDVERAEGLHAYGMATHREGRRVRVAQMAADAHEPEEGAAPTDDEG